LTTGDAVFDLMPISTLRLLYGPLTATEVTSASTVSGFLKTALKRLFSFSALGIRTGEKTPIVGFVTSHTIADCNEYFKTPRPLLYHRRPTL
jgi:hypothetical protein